MVPCDVLVPRAKAMFSSPDGGVAQRDDHERRDEAEVEHQDDGQPLGP